MIALSERPRIIVSPVSGNLVRFNGNYSRDKFIIRLQDFVNFDTTCPVEAGMGIPREPIRIVDDGTTKVLGVQTSKDYTSVLTEFTSENIQFTKGEIDGFIMKQKSPSCGIFSVKNYLPNGHPHGRRAGIFGEAGGRVLQLPIEEEGLTDPVLREVFLRGVYAHHDCVCYLRKSRPPDKSSNFTRRKNCCY